MGSALAKVMKKQTLFANYTFPKLKQSNPPIQLTDSDLQKMAIKSLKSSIDPSYLDKNTYRLYSFESKKQYQSDYNGVYKLPQSLSILTYNIWFEEHNKNVRYECIVKMLGDSNADFICLQQVTQTFTHVLHNLPNNGWIKNYYVGVIPMGWYDTIILSKYKCKFYKIPFKYSGMGRSMLFAEIIEQKGNNVIIGCMHYESLGGNQKVREQQLMAVQQVTKNCSRVIIVGDYNFSDFAQQNKKIDKQFVDLWLHIHKTQKNGFTMPKTQQFAAWRPDHILCKLPKSVDLSKSEIERIGLFTVPPFEKDQFNKIQIDRIVRTPSDHFGLVAWVPLI